jgi:PST family polysaccharide transporter
LKKSFNILHYYIGKVKKHRTLVENFSYITVFQVFSLLIPIITYPYLIRKLGSDIYGLIAFSQAITGYLIVLVSFGFNTSATQEISINRNNPAKISEIVSSVMIIKTVLFLISCIILSALTLLIPDARNHKALFYLSLWICLYDVLFPVWYFQGIERMKFITYINLISRTIFIILIFVFIRSPKDYLFLPISNGLGAIIAGTISLMIVFNRDKVRFSFQPLATLRQYFNTSRPIFVSYLASRIYDGSSKIIIGNFLGMTEVAYYDLAEKITSVLKIPQSILSQTVFPKISLEKDILFVMKILKITVLFHLILLILVVLFSKLIVTILGGDLMISAYAILNILALTLPIVAAGNIFGTQILIPFGHYRDFQNTIVFSAIIYIVLFLLLWSLSSVTLVSITILTVIIEAFITTMFIIKCRQNSLLNHQ